MTTTQSTLTSYEPAETRTTERDSSSNADHTTARADHNFAPPDQRGGDRCCPWCLAASETFERGQPGREGLTDGLGRPVFHRLDFRSKDEDLAFNELGIGEFDENAC